MFLFGYWQVLSFSSDLPFEGSALANLPTSTAGIAVARVVVLIRQYTFIPDKSCESPAFKDLCSASPASSKLMIMSQGTSVPFEVFNELEQAIAIASVSLPTIVSVCKHWIFGSLIHRFGSVKLQPAATNKTILLKTKS